jgi:hypothetical protein
VVWIVDLLIYSNTVLRSEQQMEVFPNVLEECQLSDLGFTRSKFTWCNNRTDHPFSRERLDRAVTNLNWCGNFKDMDIRVLAASNFDHCPLLIYYGRRRRDYMSRNQTFKFKDNWMVKDEC